MNTTKTYDISGMHCASCANIIERTFSKIEGVSKIEVNYATEQAKIAFDETKVSRDELSKKIEPLGYTLMDHAHTPSAADMNMSADEHAEHTGR